MFVIRKTTNKDTEEKITVDIEGLKAMLSCGAPTAREVGELAHARVVLGRRVLYSVEKVKNYIYTIAE